MYLLCAAGDVYLRCGPGELVLADRAEAAPEQKLHAASDLHPEPAAFVLLEVHVVDLTFGMWQRRSGAGPHDADQAMSTARVHRPESMARGDVGQDEIETVRHRDPVHDR